MFRRLGPCMISLSLGIFVISGSGAHAVAIDETESRSWNGSTVEGSLHGDLEGNILTLNDLPPRSDLSVDLADPPPIPLPSANSYGPFCGGFNCTITMHFNGNVTPTLEPWRFRMGGTVEFDPGNPGGGTANLTATPYMSTIGFLNAAITPSFTVAASQEYSLLTQPFANAAAVTAQAVLNAGNWTLSADGTGTWNQIDLGTISALMNEVGNMTEVDLSFEDIMMSGIFSYNRQLDFDNSIVDYFGDSLISLFRNKIDIALTDLMIELFDNNINDAAPELDYNCSATRRQDSTRAADVVCTLDQDFHFSIENARSVVSAPATGGLLALAIPALLMRRRRKEKAAA